MQPWKSLSASLEVGTLTPGWNLDVPPADKSEALRVFRFTVFFNSRFDAPPVVHLGLTGFDIDQRDTSRLGIRAAEITDSSFVAEIFTWRNTRVYSVAFGWLAIGA